MRLFPLDFDFKNNIVNEFVTESDLSNQFCGEKGITETKCQKVKAE